MFLNWTVNSRSLLPLAPLGGDLVARALSASSFVTSARRWIAFGALAPGALLAFAVAWADYEFALATRNAVAQLTERHGHSEGHAWFLGHWGFQYYMERAGVRPVDLANGHLAAGDLLFAAENNATPELPRQSIAVLEVLELPIAGWISTMSVVAHAGLHSSVFGPIPFAIGTPPKEHFLVARVTEPIRGVAGQLVSDP